MQRQSTELRKMGPLAANDPLVVGVFDVPSGLTRSGEKCSACDEAFKVGDYVTLIPLGPGRDDEAREKARLGRPYTAVAVPVHWACATGDLQRD